MNKEQKNVVILGIESSCDDTSAAIIRDGIMLSNVIASQAVHAAYGGLAGAPAEHHPRGTRSLEAGGRDQRRPERHRLHAGTGTTRLAAGGHLVCQRIRTGLGHPAGGREPPARARAGALHQRGERGRTASAIPFPVPAGVGRQLANHPREGLQRPGSHRADDRRRGGRSLRQMRQGDGAALPRRPAHRPPGAGGQPAGVPPEQTAHTGLRLQLQRAENVVPLPAARRGEARPRLRGQAAGGPVRLVAGHRHRHPDGQTA